MYWWIPFGVAVIIDLFVVCVLVTIGYHLGVEYKRKTREKNTSPQICVCQMTDDNYEEWLEQRLELVRRKKMLELKSEIEAYNKLHNYRDADGNPLDTIDG